MTLKEVENKVKDLEKIQILEKQVKDIAEIKASVQALKDAEGSKPASQLYILQAQGVAEDRRLLR
jgi:hypothetical protein